jgi:hypothetical protein
MSGHNDSLFDAREEPCALVLAKESVHYDMRSPRSQIPFDLAGGMQERKCTSPGVAAV